MMIAAVLFGTVAGLSGLCTTLMLGGSLLVSVLNYTALGTIATLAFGVSEPLFRKLPRDAVL